MRVAIRALSAITEQTNSLHLNHKPAKCANAQTPQQEPFTLIHPFPRATVENDQLKGFAMQSTKGRILCTEDDVDTRELIDFVLTQYGYEVICSASNVQAIDLAKTQNFDLYLVDNWVPGLSGTELTEKLREFDLKTPVLFYSGAAYKTDREAARVSGAQGYLVKPANGDQLIAEVTRLIAESKTT